MKNKNYLTKKLTKFLASKMYDHQQQENKLSENKIAHGLMWILLNPIIFILIFLTGFLTGYLHETFLAFSFVLLRTFSNGRHLENPDLCFILSFAFIVLLSHYSYDNSLVNFYMNCVSFVLVYLYAPSNRKQFANENKQSGYLLKLISLFIVILSFIVDNNIISLAIFLQSSTLVDKKSILWYDSNR